MTVPTILTGFAEIAADYDGVICDIWGVLHNGQAPFPGVDDALAKYRAQGGKVLLLSNAPRPGPATLKRLKAVGNRPSSYDDILTSGDATRTLLNDLAAQSKTCCHIGPDKDADLFAGLAIQSADEETADIVLFSGMYHDTSETPDDYADMLARFKARDLPLICANPDRLVQKGDKVLYCAGAVAELYENMGGKVMWMGKPYPVVYQRAKAMLAAMSGMDKPRLLAIGDGPKTDILGAQTIGVDALFITGGLADALGASVDTAQDISALLAAENTHAAYAMRHLIW